MPFYCDGEAPLEALTDKFGSRLEHLDRKSKFILLATIAVTAAVDDDALDLTDAYDCIEQSFLDEIIHTDLIAMLPQLNTLRADNLLGLCEALISQLRYTKEVA
jgi:cell division protein ZapA (FtsZ GTPase activity inhibitor)